MTRPTSLTKKEIKVGWFEAFVVINVILIALLLAVLMYLHRMYGVLKSINERPRQSIHPSDARKLRDMGLGHLVGEDERDEPKM